MKPTALDIKIALMEYYRFKRQFICAEEVFCCGVADILVDTGTKIIEVEVKISKYDLIKGEAKKRKHNRIHKFSKWYPNQYYICVPTDLLEVAKEWVEKTNNKYGIIEYEQGVKGYGWVFTRKRAKNLQDYYSTALKKNIIMRCSSMAVDRLKRIQQINQMGKEKNENQT